MKLELTNKFLQRISDLMKFVASEKSIIQQNVSMEIKSTSDEVMKRLKEIKENEGNLAWEREQIERGREKNNIIGG